MTAIKNYPRDFVERTIKLLGEVEPAAKEKGLEVTFLLNCLLGMVVSVLENVNKLNKTDYAKSIFSVKLNSSEFKDIIPKKIKALRGAEIITPYKKQINDSEFLKDFETLEINIKPFRIKFLPMKELLNNDLIWLLKKIRNGIAHQNIMPTSQSDNWDGIRIWNHNNTGMKDFAIEFNISQLKKFSRMVAEKYLESLKGQNTDNKT